MKRFTETSKWSDPWFRKLPARLKCLWMHLVDTCDAAGVIDPDWELIAFQVGEEVTENDVTDFGDRLSKLSNGKLWIRDFIKFQYGEISRDCRAHGPVFKSIEANDLERVSKGYSKGIHTPKDKDKDKDKVLDKEEGRGEKPKAKASSEQEVIDYVKSLGFHDKDGSYLWDSWEAGGWMRGNKAIKDWKATARTWIQQGFLPSQKQKGGSHGQKPSSRGVGSTYDPDGRIASQY